MIISLVLGPDHLSPTLIEKQVGGGGGGWPRGLGTEGRGAKGQLASTCLNLPHPSCWPSWAWSGPPGYTPGLSLPCPGPRLMFAVLPEDMGSHAKQRPSQSHQETGTEYKKLGLPCVESAGQNNTRMASILQKWRCECAKQHMPHGAAWF